MVLLSRSVRSQRTRPCLLARDFKNDGNGAAIDYQATGRQESIVDCRLIGNQALFLTENTFGGYVRDCLAQSTVANASASSSNIGTGALAGSIGFAVDQGVIINCRAIGFHVGFALVGGFNTTGNATFVNGCKAIQCNNGFSLGYGSYDTSHGNFTQGIQLVSNHAERCGIGIFNGNGGSALIAANVISGDEGPAVPAQIQSMTWASRGGGTVTVTTVDDHNIGSWNAPVLKVSPREWTPDGTGNQLVTATVTGAKTFTYTGVGSSPPPFVSGTWNYPCLASISVSQGGGTAFIGNMLRCRSGYDFALNKPGQGPGVQERMLAMCMNGSRAWYFHDGETPGGNWEFIQCAGSNFAPYVKYAGLANVAKEGNEFNIVDGQKSGGGAATFGDIVQGGGSGQYKVRYNGSNWIRIG